MLFLVWEEKSGHCKVTAIRASDMHTLGNAEGQNRIEALRNLYSAVKNYSARQSIKFFAELESPTRIP